MWRTAHIGQRRFDTYVFRILLLLFWHNNAPPRATVCFFAVDHGGAWHCAGTALFGRIVLGDAGYNIGHVPAHVERRFVLIVCAQRLKKLLMAVGAGFGQILCEVTADGLKAILLDDVHRLDEQVVLRRAGNGTVKFQIDRRVSGRVMTAAVACLELLSDILQIFLRCAAGG